MYRALATLYRLALHPGTLSPRSSSSGHAPLSPLFMRAGPSRALFLPGGLLAPTDVPVYLNGSLAGE